MSSTPGMKMMCSGVMSLRRWLAAQLAGWRLRRGGLRGFGGGTRRRLDDGRLEAVESLVEGRLLAPKHHEPDHQDRPDDGVGLDHQGLPVLLLGASFGRLKARGAVVCSVGPARVARARGLE